MLELALPDPSPIAQIIHHSVHTSVYEPERQHYRTAPEDDARRQAYPEHDGLP